MEFSSEAELRRFAAANNEFAVGLYQELRKNDGNLFLAPFSVRSALTAVYAGARGRTAFEMALVLHLSVKNTDVFRTCRDFATELASRAESGAVEIASALALWSQTDLALLASYTEIVKDALGAQFMNADFERSPDEAVRIINSWAMEKTRGRIAQLTGPESVDRSTRLVLASAIFFQGKWALPFAKSETRPAPFRLPRSAGTVQVAMMNLEDSFKYAQLDGFQAAEFPYLGGKMSMVVLLPDARDGWIDLEKRLSAPELSQWFGDLKEERIDVSLPKFEIGTSFRLDQELGRMGLRDAFGFESADFSGMTLEKPFGISAITHSARIEVDEAGTLAAAATAISLVRGVNKKPVFRADHPFLVFIRDIPTETILFIGRVLKPEWTGEASETPARPSRLTRLMRILGLK